MTTGYILIVAILVLGGVIATVGDRIGTRVGKARLSLFNLRPKKTAVLVTILTGGLISSSTLGILFAADEKLRQGVFELEDIQKDLRNKREQLKTAENQKSQIEKELSQAKEEQAQAQEALKVINKSLEAVNTKQQKTAARLQATIREQAQTSTRLQHTQTELNHIVDQYEQAINELESVDAQRQKLQTAVEQLRTKQQRLYREAKKAIENRDGQINRLDSQIKQRNQEIISREEIIKQRESRLEALEKQQNYLEEEVARLEKYYQSYHDLRLGKLALARGEVLAAEVVRADNPDVARQLIIQILQLANRKANLELTEPGATPQQVDILRVSPQGIEQLSRQIQDGREYIVRIFSAGNYVRGESQIEFFADAAPNQLVFSSGEVLASSTADPKTMTFYQLWQRVDLLVSASKFRARNAGIVEVEQVGDDDTSAEFLSQIRQYDKPLEIQAIAAGNIYTVGPLRIKFLAILNGEVVFSS